MICCLQLCLTTIVTCLVLLSRQGLALDHFDCIQALISPKRNSLQTSTRARITQDELALFRRDDLLQLDNNSIESELLELDKDHYFGIQQQETISKNPRTLNPLSGDRLPLELSLSRHQVRQQDNHVNAINNNSNNDTFNSKSIPKKRFRSTGTTIAGCLVENGRYVVLGADTRATDDRMVADKYCAKIHCLAPTVYACGAGTSGDLDALTKTCKFSLQLEAMQNVVGNNGKQQHSFGSNDDDLPVVNMSAVCRFLRNALYEGGGDVEANLIVGGMNDGSGGASLVAIHPHGSMDVVPYAALGSGGLAAMSVLEQAYRPSLTLDQGKALVERAIRAGIQNDLGSGGLVDICIIGSDEARYIRASVPEEQVVEKEWTTEKDNVETEYRESKGVNGFGNVPFTIQSRRVLSLVNDSKDEAKQWDELLGLTDLE